MNTTHPCPCELDDRPPCFYCAAVDTSNAFEAFRQAVLEALPPPVAALARELETIEDGRRARLHAFAVVVLVVFAVAAARTLFAL